MKYLIPIILFITILFSCNKKEETIIKEHNYNKTELLPFLNQLYTNHKYNFEIIHKEKYIALCEENNLNKEDSINIEAIGQILFFHRIFTNNTSKNCNMSEILSISYFLHWNKYKPRHRIINNKLGKKLKELPPPADKNLYQTYADLDRTPFIFLNDLFSTNLKYSKQNCDSFSTFGWCSEIEMSFSLLLQLMNYKSIVELTSNGGHSFSSITLPLVNNNNDTLNFKIEVDNTYNKIRLLPYKKEKRAILDIEKWYNKQSKSKKEKKKVKQIEVPQTVSSYIENSINNYLRKQ